MKNKEKVFCIKCVHYKKLSTCRLFDECEAPENMGYALNPIKQKIIHLDSPYTLNKNNNCEWFTPKQSFFASFKKLSGKKNK